MGAPHLLCEGIPSPVSAHGCFCAEPADLSGGDRGESLERWKGLCWVFAKLGLNSSGFPRGCACCEHPCAVSIPVPGAVCLEAFRSRCVERLAQR